MNPETTLETATNCPKDGVHLWGLPPTAECAHSQISLELHCSQLCTVEEICKEGDLPILRLPL